MSASRFTRQLDTSISRTLTGRLNGFRPTASTSTTSLPFKTTAPFNRSATTCRAALLLQDLFQAHLRHRGPTPTCNTMTYQPRTTRPTKHHIGPHRCHSCAIPIHPSLSLSIINTYLRSASHRLSPTYFPYCSIGLELMLPLPDCGPEHGQTPKMDQQGPYPWTTSLPALPTSQTKRTHFMYYGLQSIDRTWLLS